MSLRCPTMTGMSDMQGGTVIDAALRFVRSNPELVRYAERNALTSGASVDDLLRDAIARVAALRAREQAAGTPTDHPLLRAI